MLTCQGKNRHPTSEQLIHIQEGTAVRQLNQEDLNNAVTKLILQFTLIQMSIQYSIPTVLRCSAFGSLFPVCFHTTQQFYFQIANPNTDSSPVLRFSKVESAISLSHIEQGVERTFKCVQCPFCKSQVRQIPN